MGSDGNQEMIIYPFSRERSIHARLGGGKVADVLLWRNKWVSAALMVGIMAIWSLFEFAEYNLVTFLCHLTITTMLLIFIWSTGANTFKWTPPDIPKILLEESRIYKDLAVTTHNKINFFLSNFLYIACGYDIKLFCLAILTLSLVSTIGNYISTVNLLFIGFLFMGTMPFLYENHEEDIYYLVHTVHKNASKTFKAFDEKVLSKIPKGPMKQKKFS